MFLHLPKLIYILAVQLENFMKIDTHHPADEPKRQKVLAIRYESIPEIPGSATFTKQTFTKAVSAGQMGYNNILRMFGKTKREKCTLVLLDKLPDELLESISRGQTVSQYDVIIIYVTLIL